MPHTLLVVSTRTARTLGDASVGIEPVTCAWGRSWAHKRGASRLMYEVDLGKM